MARQAQDYQTLHNALRRAGALAEAAEIHGSLCAVLCVAGSPGTELWRADSLDSAEESNAQVPQARTALEHLELETWAALNGSAMEFAPLLPDDSVELAQRVTALAHWCQGFLYGITLSGVTRTTPTAAMGAEHFDELVKDLAEIARAGLATDENMVEADFAYIELVEFVRAGVQLLFEELAGFRDTQPAQRHSVH